MWFGIAQWAGIYSNNDLDYVLPNLSNFGCRLYSETDLYSGGTGKGARDFPSLSESNVIKLCLR